MREAVMTELPRRSASAAKAAIVDSVMPIRYIFPVDGLSSGV